MINEDYKTLIGHLLNRFAWAFGWILIGFAIGFVLIPEIPNFN